MLWLVAWCLVLVGCESGQDTWGPEEPDLTDSFFTGFTISVARSSRALAADGPYETGEELESTIGSGDYGFYLFDSQNRLISRLGVNSLNLTATDGITDTYDVVTRVEKTDLTEAAFASGCKVVALANWGEYPALREALASGSLEDASTLDDLCAAAEAVMPYSQECSTLSQDRLMPFYGIKAIPTLTFVNNRAQAGTIYFLRALAKVQVALTAASGFQHCELTGVKLTRAATQALKAPKGVYHEDDYMTGSWFTDYTPAAVPDEAGMIDVAFTQRDADGVFTAYVPESINVDSDGSPLDEESRSRLLITFNSEDGEQSGYIDFKYYEGNQPQGIAAGTHFNLCRNNLYRFNLSRVKGGELDAQVDVIPYAEINLAPSFGLNYDPVSAYREVWDGAHTAIRYWQDAAGNNWTLKTDADRTFTIAYYTDQWGNINWKRADHWFDNQGNRKSLIAADIAGMTAVTDSWGNPLYWLDKDMNQKWLVQNENFSVKVYTFYPGTEDKVSSYNPWGTPECWYDYRGIRHEMTEDEAPIIQKWTQFLAGL